jgi:hypothetical protein
VAKCSEHSWGDGLLLLMMSNHGICGGGGGVWWWKWLKWLWCVVMVVVAVMVVVVVVVLAVDCGGSGVGTAGGEWSLVVHGVVFVVLLPTCEPMTAAEYLAISRMAEALSGIGPPNQNAGRVTLNGGHPAHVGGSAPTRCGTFSEARVMADVRTVVPAEAAASNNNNLHGDCAMFRMSTAAGENLLESRRWRLLQSVHTTTMAWCVRHVVPTPPSKTLDPGDPFVKTVFLCEKRG